jgi:diacylglycerol kinase family enzyme
MLDTSLDNSTVWLAFNEGSGSNDAAAHRALEEAFEQAGCRLQRQLRFPHEAAPDRPALAAGKVDVLAIFAGDGTIHSILGGLSGWDGAVLVLPGGTMNLLSRRLHGEADPATIVARVAQGRARRVRPTTIRSRHGDALTGILAGPGTAWNEVREAMRGTDIPGIVTGTKEAITESTTGTAVICREPAAGRDEGYAAMMLTPRAAGIELSGFYADTVADYVRQGMALLRRNFRDGPHETLGTHPKIRLSAAGADPIGLLVDGEPAQAGTEATFELGRCALELLATIETEPD